MNNIFNQSINENYIGEVKLGNNILSLKKLWVYGHKNNFVSCEFINPNFFKLTFKNSLLVKVNLLEDKICQISVFHNYTGRFNNIGIGSSLQELTFSYPNIEYDDDEKFFYIPEYKNLAFFFKEPYSMGLDNKIEEITLNDSELLLYP